MAKYLSWVEKFIDKELFAPFIVKKDSDYYTDLSKKFEVLYKDAQKAGADNESLHIIQKYTKKIKEAVLAYYKGKISTAHIKIKNLVSDCIDNKIAVNTICQSDAFAGTKGTEIQFYRARVINYLYRQISNKT